MDLPGILVMYLSVAFLIIPSAPTITGTEIVLSSHIFLNFHFLVFVFTHFMTFFDWYVIIC